MRRHLVSRGALGTGTKWSLAPPTRFATAIAEAHAQAVVAVPSQCIAAGVRVHEGAVTGMDVHAFQSTHARGLPHRRGRRAARNLPIRAEVSLTVRVRESRGLHVNVSRIQDLVVRIRLSDRGNVRGSATAAGAPPSVSPAKHSPAIAPAKILHRRRLAKSPRTSVADLEPPPAAEAAEQPGPKGTLDTDHSTPYSRSARASGG